MTAAAQATSEAEIDGVDPGAAGGGATTVGIVTGPWVPSASGGSGKKGPVIGTTHHTAAIAETVPCRVIEAPVTVGKAGGRQASLGSVILQSLGNAGAEVCIDAVSAPRDAVAVGPGAAPAVPDAAQALSAAASALGGVALREAARSEAGGVPALRGAT